MTPSLRTRRSAQARHRLLAVWLTFAITVGLMVASPVEQAVAATCPCTIFTATQTPTTPAENDTGAVEVGVKLRSDQAGFVSGIRFYKGTGNGGTHTGSLWSSTGTRLATVTFTGETATGWQQATFATPVAINANTTYVASYYAPQGRYASDESYFATTGVINSPLTALANGVDGGNGVYRYGTGGGFPNSSYQASNYWVDVVFTGSGADTVKPTVTNRQPVAGATDVAVNSGAAATFSEDVQPATIVMTLTAGGAVASTRSYDAASRTVTLTPSAALTASTTYTVNLSGAKDVAGNTMDPVSWTFTTASAATGCPCTVWTPSTIPSTTAAADNSAVEVGLKFRANQAGYVTAVRFYKGTGNTGTHVGSLWTRTGTKLASVTFTGETATGWQQATFGAPIPVAANTTYVASYYAPVGRYAANASYFATAATTRGPLTALANGTDGGNGVYRYGASGFPSSAYQSTNYWVDPVFTTSATDTTAPTIAARTPAAGASGVSTTAPVTATFSEPVVAASVAMSLTGPGGAAVAGTVSYDPPSQTASFTPSSALAYSTAYTITVSGAKDTSNNTMTASSWSFTTSAPPPPSPDQGPGGPIAVVTSSANPYSKYLAEILRTEGLNEFASIDVSTLSPTTLAAYDVVILGAVPVTSAQVTSLTTWVNGGGNLITLRPDAALAPLLGITSTGTPLSDGYLKIDTTTAPGAGIVAATMQYHGASDRYALSSGTASVATLYSNATTSTGLATVTLRSVGTSGGQVAAFGYDLAKSIALTRQGNPAWAGTERDSMDPIRSDDMFFGGASTSWIDFSKVAIPQADEQQRLLANMIQLMNRDKKPLPRFWYFPKGLKAVLVGTGDDHGNNGTAGRFDQFIANSPAGCSVSDWTCLRYSSYLYPSTPLSNAAAVNYNNQGFEVGVHASTNCGNYSASSIASVYASDFAAWRANYPGLPASVSTRLHCIVFSDWASQPKVEIANGIRMDTNYYYWPGSWVQDRPGFMTGSGMPMRFTDTDGSMIDNYQAATQMTDESNQTFPYNVDTLLDNALGTTGYYGAFVANFHTDLSTEPESDALLASAKSHNVPIVSGRQMTSWLDGRNGSSYADLTWNANTLSFSVAVGSGATNLTGMLPVAGPNGTQLTAMTRGGSALPYTVVTIKGLDYAQFAAAAGAYAATYGSAAAPAVAQVAAKATTATTTADTPTGTATTAKPTTTIAWTTTTTATSKVLIGTSPSKLSATKVEGVSIRKHSVALTGLKPSTRYYYRVVSTDTTGRATTSPALTAAPASFVTAAVDKVAPLLSDLNVTPLADGTALVRWTTDEKAVDTISLGTSATNLKSRPLNRVLGLQHSVVLTRLTAGSTYYLSVSSADAVGNTVTSGVVRFVMVAGGVAQQTAASFRTGKLTGDAVVSDTGTGSVTLGGEKLLARKGGYVSSILDAHQMVDWDRALFKADRPVGTKSTIEVRFGSTSTPDATWTDWVTVGAKGRIAGSSRYLQYRVGMSTPLGVLAPALYGIGFSNNGQPLDLEHESDHP